jgi:hypothetical protein
MIFEETEGSYESMIPIVLILENKDIAEFESSFTKNGYRYQVGVSSEVLMEIRNWDYGILIL